MTLSGVFVGALYGTGGVILAMTLSIVITKSARTVVERRRAALVAEIRPLVLAGIEGDQTIPALTGRRTTIAESIVIALLPKLRGADRDALTAMLSTSGIIDNAIEGLGSWSAARRQRSVELLGNAGYGAAENDLVRLLHDRDVGVRINAGRALGRAGGSLAVTHLFTALAERRIPANTASMAVLRIGSTGAPSIVAATASTVPAVRSTAVELAGSLGVMEARSSIESLLDDDDVIVRTSAARALGRLSMQSSAPPLILRLSSALERPFHRADEDFLVAMIVALGQIGDRSSITVLESCFMRRHRMSVAATTALAGMGPRRSMTSKQERLEQLLERRNARRSARSAACPWPPPIRWKVPSSWAPPRVPTVPLAQPAREAAVVT